MLTYNRAAPGYAILPRNGQCAGLIINYELRKTHNYLQVIYCSLMIEGPLWIVCPSPSFAFLLRSKTSLKECGHYKKQVQGTYVAHNVIIILLAQLGALSSTQIDSSNVGLPPSLSPR